MRSAPRNEKYTTPWMRVASTGRLFRLCAGTLQVATAATDGGDYPAEETIADAYIESSCGGLRLSPETLEGIVRDLRAKFNELWRTLPMVTAVVIPDDHLGLGTVLITAVLHDWADATGLPEPVADFESAKADDWEPHPQVLFKLISRAVTAWRRERPEEWNAEDAFDTVTLLEVLTANEVPAALVGSLQAHGILHLDFQPNYEGDWQASLDLPEDDDDGK